MGSSSASCPVCGRPGQVGALCATPSCNRRKYHCIPAEYVGRDDAAVDGIVGQKWGDYLLVRPITTGGVGAIYLALQMPLGMQAAVKILTNNAPPALAARLRDEAQALARINHHHVVRLLKYGQADRRTYLVMDYVADGRTLTDALARNELNRPAFFQVVRQLIDALGAAHALQVVHRDIKPDNIMLQRLPHDPNYVKLVDFGLAKFTDGGRESTELAAGTPTYMAPEQITRRGIGPWTDWYAVTMIALEVLLDERPYAHLATDEVVRAKMRADHDPTAVLDGADLPPAVLHFFRSGLATDTRQRPRDARSFRAGFEAMVSALPAPGAPLDPTLNPANAIDRSALRKVIATVPDPEDIPLGGGARLPADATQLTPEPPPTLREMAAVRPGPRRPTRRQATTHLDDAHRRAPAHDPPPARHTPAAQRPPPPPTARHAPSAQRPPPPPARRANPPPAPREPSARPGHGPRRTRPAEVPPAPVRTAPQALAAPVVPPPPARRRAVQRTMLVEPIRDDGPLDAPRGSTWRSLMVVFFLVGLGVLAAVVWLMLNPPQASRSDVVPATPWSSVG